MGEYALGRAQPSERDVMKPGLGSAPLVTAFNARPGEARKALNHAISWALGILVLGWGATLTAAPPLHPRTRIENLIPMPSSVKATGERNGVLGT